MGYNYAEQLHRYHDTTKASSARLPFWFSRFMFLLRVERYSRRQTNLGSCRSSSGSHRSVITLFRFSPQFVLRSSSFTFNTILLLFIRGPRSVGHYRRYEQTAVKGSYRIWKWWRTMKHTQKEQRQHLQNKIKRKSYRTWMSLALFMGISNDNNIFFGSEFHVTVVKGRASTSWQFGVNLV